MGAALGERAQAQIADEAASKIEVHEEEKEEEEEPIVVNSPYEIVGSALTIAHKIVRKKEKAATVKSVSTEVMEQVSGSEEKDEELVDCPGCGAGIPKEFDTCILCGTKIAFEGKVEKAAPVGAEKSSDQNRDVQVSHRHAYLSVSSPGLMVFFVIVTSAFLAFVYFIAR